MNDDKKTSDDLVKIAADLKQANLRIAELEKQLESHKQDVFATIKELERRMNMR